MDINERIRKRATRKGKVLPAPPAPEVSKDARKPTGNELVNAKLRAKGNKGRKI